MENNLWPTLWHMWSICDWYKTHVRQIFMARLRIYRCTYTTCQKRMLCMFCTCQERTLCMFCTCQKQTLCMFCTCQERISDQEWTHSMSAVGFGFSFTRHPWKPENWPQNYRGNLIHSWNWNYFLNHLINEWKFALG